MSQDSAVELDEDTTLGLVDLRERNAVGRACIHDRRTIGMGRGQHLVTMHVTGGHIIKGCRDSRPLDNVLAGTEAMVSRAAGGRLESLVNGEDVHVGAIVAPAGGSQRVVEVECGLTPKARERGHGQPHATAVESKGRGPVDHVNTWVGQQHVSGDRAPFVVARDNYHVDAGDGQRQKWLGGGNEGPVARRGAIEHIARVDDHVDRELAGPPQHTFVAADDIVATARPIVSGPCGPVGADV
jgi:hypothetical protein